MLTARAARSNRQASRAGFLGSGLLALLLTTASVAALHPSAISLREISAAPAAARPAPGTAALIAALEQTIRGGRLFAPDASQPETRGGAVVMDQTRTSRPAARTGRLPGHRVAWLPSGMAAVALQRTGRVAPRPQPAEVASVAAPSMHFPEPDRLNPAPAPKPYPAREVAALLPADLAAPAIDAALAPPDVPLPTLRPAETAPPAAPSKPHVADVAPETDAESAAEAITASLPLPEPRPKHQAPADLLAYARPEESAGGIRQSMRRVALPGPGSGIAVYDIKAATVYLPDGERLEAHSGLGRMHDKPRFADVKNAGPTPPNVYDLVMRERPFHGVEAIRLLPSDGVNKYGRVGLLAHTYMLHGSNQSNGCVVFKDYRRFLKAFKKGKIDHLVVVPDLSALPRMMASL